MAQGTVSARMDESIRAAFEASLEQMGMSISTGINVFARAVIREGRIPFEIRTGDAMSNHERVLQGMEDIRAGRMTRHDLDELEATFAAITAANEGGAADGG